MTKKERIALQRVMAREALGKLMAISELFGAEDNPIPERYAVENWQARVKDFEAWIFNYSDLA